MEEPQDNAVVASGSVVQKDNAVVASGSVVQKDEFGLDVCSRPQSKLEQDLDRLDMVLKGADQKQKLIELLKERDEPELLFDIDDPFGGLV